MSAEQPQQQVPQQQQTATRDQQVDFKEYMGSPMRQFMLGWPLLLCAWLYIAWFIQSATRLSALPVVHEGSAFIDKNWFRLLLPTMFVPSVVVFAYLNWLGWKFFRHN